MTGQVLLDVAAYSVQLVALVAGAIAVTRSLPVDEPRAELRLWRALLAAAVLLPVAGLFAGAGGAQGIVRSRFLDAGVAMTGLPEMSAWPAVVTALLLLGSILRVAWLGIGVIWIGRWVARARIVDAMQALGMPPDARRLAAVRMSHDVEAPATVGWRRPDDPRAAAILRAPRACPAFGALARAAARAAPRLGLARPRRDLVRAPSIW